MGGVNKSPCLGCELRIVGCHVGCSAYNEWRIEKRNIQRAIADKKLIENSVLRNNILYNYRPYNPSGRFRFGLR